MEHWSLQFAKYRFIPSVKARVGARLRQACNIISLQKGIWNSINSSLPEDRRQVRDLPFYRGGERLARARARAPPANFIALSQSVSTARRA